MVHYHKTKCELWLWVTQAQKPGEPERSHSVQLFSDRNEIIARVGPEWENFPKSWLSINRTHLLLLLASNNQFECFDANAYEWFERRSAISHKSSMRTWQEVSQTGITDLDDIYLIRSMLVCVQLYDWVLYTHWILLKSMICCLFQSTCNGKWLKCLASIQAVVLHSVL